MAVQVTTQNPAWEVNQLLSIESLSSFFFFFLGRRTVKAQPAEFTCHASQGCQQDIRPQPAPTVGVLQHQWGSACSDTPDAQISRSPGTVSLHSTGFFNKVYDKV